MTRQRCWMVLGLMLAWAQLVSALEMALVPPVDDPALADTVRSLAAGVGIDVTTLEPAQLADQTKLTPAAYGIAVVVGGERYADTINVEGDASSTLQAFVDQGGSLLVVANGLVLGRPQRWDGANWTPLPAPLRRVALQTHLGLLDAGQSLDLDLPPGVQFVTGPGSPLASFLPERFAPPADAGHYRPIPSNQEADVEFTPMATLVDADGGTYGAGVAEMHRRDAGAGSVYYCWEPLLRGEHGQRIFLGLLTLHAGRTLGADAIGRRDDLLGQLTHLDRQLATAEEILPPDLQSDALKDIREELRGQAETLRSLREAAQAGNLDYVVGRLTEVRDRLADMPVRVGRAVDAAVAEALARPVGQPEQPEQPGGEQPQPGSGVTGSGEGGVVGTETTPGTTTPPAETTPGTTTPTETTPGTTSPPAETTPGTTTPPAETTPGTTTPPAETTPGTATPPAETTPGTTTPPAETTPPPMTTDTPPAPSPPVEPGAVPTPGEGTTEPSPPAETTPPPAERPAEPARMFPDATGPVVELEVKNRGSVYVELYPKAAPKTSSAFLYLVREGFYDQTYFHRRVADFVVQGGDPLSRDRPLDDPELGTGGPEWTVPGEFSRELHHERGTLGLARAPSDPDSGGSQFYVCLSNQPTLDGQYAIFGHVVQGMNIVDQIQVGDRIVKAKVVQGADSTNAAGVGPLDLFKGQ